MSPTTHTEGDDPTPALAKTEAKSAQPRKLSGPRKWLFRLLAMTLVPALVFGILELTLWLIGYGYPTNFFLDGSKVEGAEVWIDNPDYGRRMFPRSLQHVPQPLPFVLPKVKQTGTYRIFVVGESAAQGFPDPSTSFARVLEVLLRARYPDTRFEVVNTAMVAINSNVALPIARECTQHQPDLLVVHLGNNEVVGPFGAAGVLGPFSPNLSVVRANLAVKTTGSGQLLDQLLQGITSGQQSPRNWDGMSMFVNSQVSADDSRLPRVYAHFRQNLADICQAGEDAGIPVVLCTIPVNLKDSAPFGSLHAANLDSERTEAWEKLYQAGKLLQAEKKFAEASHCYEQAEQIDDGFAELAYRLGQCQAALGDNGQARRHYLHARDRDVLRFRADTTINDTIRDVAAARAAQRGGGVRLAEAERAFALASPGEMPGEDLFLEHVHMTFAGNYLLARTVFETIENPAPAALGPPALTPLSAPQCAERLAYTDWNEWEFGTKIYERLVQGPPFTLQFDHAERAQRWQEKLAAQHQRLQAGGMANALAEYQKAVELNEGDWMIRMNFGQLLTENGRFAEANEQYREVLVHLQHSYTAHYQIGALELKVESPQRAEFHFREALRFEPNNLEANVGIAEALELQGKNAEALALYEDQLRKNPRRALALEALGRYLLRAGRLEEAKARLTAASEREPTIAAIHVDLGMVAIKQDNLDEAIGHFEDALRLQPDWPEVRAYLAEVRKKREIERH